MTPWYRRPAFLLSKRIYLRLGEQSISALCVENGKRYSDVPLVALRQVEGGKTVEAIGVDARVLEDDPSIEVVNPFAHPRVFVGDMDIAIALARNAVAAVTDRRPIWRPILIMHPLHERAGGLSDTEKRAILDMAFSAGAMGAHLHEGADLLVSEVAAFPVSKLVPLTPAQR